MNIRCVVLLVLVVLPGTLWAQSGRDARAEYEAVKKDLKADRNAEALARCERAIERPLDDELAWGFLIGAGLAAQKLGRDEAALDYLERFLAEHAARGARAGAEWQKRREGVLKQVGKLEQGLLAGHGRVTFDSSPAGAIVTLDGLPPRAKTHATPLTVFLAAGRHKLRLEREGFAPAEVDVTVAAGRRDTVHVPLVAATKPAPIVTPLATPLPVPEKPPALREPPVVKPAAPARPTDLATKPPLAVEARGDRLLPLWGWIAVGAGGVLALSGLPFTVMAVNDSSAAGNVKGATPEEHKDLYDARIADMERNQSVAWVFYGLGAAAAIGGATYLTIAALRDEAPATATPGKGVRLEPGWVPVEGGAVFTLGGRW